MSMLAVSDEQWAHEMAAARRALNRGSTAEGVTEILRTCITNGMFQPGSRLSEQALGRELRVSRNTLREAFRLLCHERLLVHEFSRGVFVRVPTLDDVMDLYRVRRILEGAAIRCAGQAPPESVAAIRAALEEGEHAASDDRWFEVGTANMYFHQAIAGLAGSSRIDESVRHLLAEMRLVFHVMAALREFHEPYLKAHRSIVELLEDGDIDSAESALGEYLERAERQLLDAYSRLEPPEV